MDALFGKERAEALRVKFQMQVTPEQREAFILEELTKALREMGGRYVLPFRFRNEKGTRTTHHLIFVTKHFRGYDIMKGVMAGYSSVSDQGVPRLEYSPADARTPLLFNFNRPLDDLEDMLQTFAGRTVEFRELYESRLWPSDNCLTWPSGKLAGRPRASLTRIDGASRAIGPGDDPCGSVTRDRRHPGPLHATVL